MKKTIKILAMILALTTAFSLCACTSGNNFDDDDDDDRRGTKPAKPTAIVETEPDDDFESNNDFETDEETDPMEETLPDVPSAEDQAVLDAYCENLYNFWDSSDPAEQQMYYDQLMELDLTVIDKWRGTEFEPEEYRYHNINWDYEAVFEAITVLEDVVLNQKTSYTDFIGNVTEDYICPTWHYNADGLITSVDNESWALEFFPSNPSKLSGIKEYTKNDAGQITQIRYGYQTVSGAFSASHLLVLTYDENGNKILETVTDTTGDSYDIFYTYDEENRLTRIEYTDSYLTTYEYTYRPDGKLAEFKYGINRGCLIEEILVFNYDESGNLISGVKTCNTWSNDFFVSEPYIDYTREDQYTFTCDEDGKLVQIDIVPGNEYYAYGSYAGDIRFEASHALQSITITYGNYFVFDSNALFFIN